MKTYKKCTAEPYSFLFFKISALSSGKIDTYEYLTGEEILSSNQQQTIEQAKFIYSPLGKTF